MAVGSRSGEGTVAWRPCALLIVSARRETDVPTTESGTANLRCSHTEPV